MEISIENNNIDHFNYSHPIKANYLAYFNSLNPFASVTRSIYYQVKTYESDNGYLFEDKKIEHPIGVDASISSESQVNTEPTDYSQPLVNLLFCIYSYYADKYSRSYQKVQSVISSIGGILSVLETVGGIFLHFFIDGAYFTDIAQNVYENKGNKVNSISPNHRKMELTNNSVVNPSELSKIKLTNQRKNILNSVSFCNGNEYKMDNLKQNCYEKLHFLDFVVHSLPFINNSKSKLIQLNTKFVKHYLSCEEIIKNEINIKKMIKLKMDSQLIQIKPDFVKETNNLNINS